MVFKKFDEQKVYQVPCVNAGGIELEVGDIFSHNPASHEVEQITSKGDALAIVNEGIRELYMVAQSDAVTEKTGTGYKDYNIGRLVNLEAGVEKIVAAYRVTMIDNVEGLED